MHSRSLPARLSTLLPRLVTLLLAALFVTGAAQAQDDATTKNRENRENRETRELPEFTVLDSDRLRTHSQDWVGQPLLLDFWATWCGPCNFTLPELQEIHEDYEDQGLRLLGISIDSGLGGGVLAKRWAEERGVTYEILHDAGSEARRAFEVRNIPALFLVDAEGQVVADWYGEPNFDEVRAKIDEVVGEKTVSENDEKTVSEKIPEKTPEKTASETTGDEGQ